VAETRDGHADHDPLIMAGLLDRDLVGAERTAAESRVATCPDCAALYADLLALASATRAFPVPSRPRDYTLSAADAARLTSPIPGEPHQTTARLAGVMTDSRPAAAHASHDTMLVASLADHSLAAAERAAAEALVATCDACADLYADIEALRVATRAMPMPTRPRDFTLTADDAVRMRPGGWRRFVAAFGTSRDMLSRPLAAGLTTLGLVGLLFATVPSILPTSTASTTPSVVDQRAGAPVGAAAPAGAPGPSGQGLFVAAPSPSGGPGDALGPAPVAAGAAASSPPTIPASNAFGSVKGTGATAAPGSEGGTTGSAQNQGGVPGQSPSVLGAAPDTSLAAESTAPSMLVVLSAAFLIAGLGLFLIRWTARRLGDA
jgi:anti-sigma factor RsiW